MRYMYKKHCQVLKVISVRKHFDNIDKKPFERKDLIKQTDGLYIEAFKHVSQIYCDNRENWITHARSPHKNYLNKYNICA